MGDYALFPFAVSRIIETPISETNSRLKHRLGNMSELASAYVKVQRFPAGKDDFFQCVSSLCGQFFDLCSKTF